MERPKIQHPASGIQRCFFWRRTLAALLGLLLFFSVGEVLAKSGGGRMGGSAGFSRSRSGGGSFSPSRPSRSYSGSPGRRGGFETRPYYGSPGWGYGPVFIGPPYGLSPGYAYGGFDGRLLFTVLLLAAFVGLLAYVALQRWQRLPSLGEEKKGGLMPYTVMKLQLALLFTARFIQKELEELALKAQTDTPEGLAELLQAVTVALSRHPEYWRYGLWEVHRAETLDEAEVLFREVVAGERAKLSQETLVNVEGRIERRALKGSEEGALKEAGGFIVVTVIVAVTRRVFDTIPKPSQEDIQRILKKLGGIIAPQLLGLEVIWSPEDPEDVLSEEELLLDYAHLNLL